jgi:hypothetical protein
MLKLLKASIVAAVLAAGALTISTVPVRAGFFFMPTPCDFITGGGFIFTDWSSRANFGAHGGCKHGGFWGHLNYVDHGGYNDVTPYHVNSIEITGYLTSDKAGFETAREVCGWARTNADPDPVRFRIRMVDNGEPGRDDRFGIVLGNGYWARTTDLGGDGPGGGNIQLHKGNNSTTGPDPAPSEIQMCDGLPSPGD